MDSDTVEQWHLEPQIRSVETRPGEEGWSTVTVTTARGPVQTRLYDAPGAVSAVLLVGGVGGGFDQPAQGLYERLGEALLVEGVSCLRVRYRNPTVLEEAVHDVLAGLALLARRGVRKVVLVGHSFGGAVVIIAAAASPLACAVVTLATQSYGADAASALGQRPILLVHGTDDEILPSRCSTHVFQIARGPKELRFIDGARHGLDEQADEVFLLVLDWLRRHVRPPASTCAEAVREPASAPSL